MVAVGTDYKAVFDKAWMFLAEGGFGKGWSCRGTFIQASVVMPEGFLMAEGKVALGAGQERQGGERDQGSGSDDWNLFHSLVMFAHGNLSRLAPTKGAAWPRMGGGVIRASAWTPARV